MLFPKKKKMKKNLEILEIEPKLTRDGKEQKYWRFKTNEGWMSCFNEKASKQLRAFIGSVACVEVIEKKGTNYKGEETTFYNITKCYGPEIEAVDIPEDEKPEVVKPGEMTTPGYPKPITAHNNNHSTNGYRTPEQMIMCEMTGHAKDIFCAMYVNDFNKEDLMNMAINLVKQAKEAFK